MATVKPRVLLLACGNPSRGDDALGPLLLSRAAELTAAHPQWGEFRCIEDFQFQVEHALELAGRDLVLFIDAAVADPAPWRFSPVAPRADASFTTHALSPAAVLEVYRRAVAPNPPPGYLLSVRGETFELGAAPSAAARANAEGAFRLLCRLCADARPRAWEQAAREAAEPGFTWPPPTPDNGASEAGLIKG